MQPPLWVFGYGSLIWHPGFPVAERRVARLSGWHRSFCMRSIHHRGTEAAPGLVLANVNYVKKVVFPLEVLPWVAALAAMVPLVAGLAVTLAVEHQHQEQ